MGLYHKTKRLVKLGLVIVGTYYVAKTCNSVTQGQEPQQRYEIQQNEEFTTKRDTIRTMDYQALQRTR